MITESVKAEGKCRTCKADISASETYVRASYKVESGGLLQSVFAAIRTAAHSVSYLLYYVNII